MCFAQDHRHISAPGKLVGSRRHLTVNEDKAA